ncbi:MAG: beta-propeller fold lactonase family protein [Burkholderiales bacterium]|nr:beta-propeller fold lactonase family protein [Burkholderiales bacterium]
MAADPTGKYLYVAGIGLQAYRIDPASGALSAIGSPVSTNNYIAKGVAVDPTGRFVYVTWGFAEQSGVSAYAIGPTGALTAVGSRQPTGDNPLAVAVAASGQFVYTANLLSGNLSGFRADATSGALTPIPGSPFPVTTSSPTSATRSRSSTPASPSKGEHAPASRFRCTRRRRPRHRRCVATTSRPPWATRTSSGAARSSAMPPARRARASCSKTPRSCT